MTRKILAIAALFFMLVTALWYFFLLSPRNSKIADLDDQLQTAIAEGAALRAAAVALRDVQENDVAFLAAIGQMETGIPEEAELAVFIEEVTALAAETGIVLQSFAPSEPAAAADLPLYEITMTLSLEGEYFDLLGFLFGLDDMERIVVVEALSITAGGDTGTDLPEGEEEEETTTTTTTTVPGSTTTTTAGGSTTSSTSTTSTSTTTTTVPTLSENILSVSLTVKLYTRSPLLPIVDIPVTGEPQAGGTEGDAAGNQAAGG
jgi:Tfp pilus assembly protein PilO